jgi:hypothetical protein
MSIAFFIYMQLLLQYSKLCGEIVLSLSQAAQRIRRK